jgi:hypothetical protein
MQSTDDRNDSGTRTLLACGVGAGPLYLTVGVMQGLLRQGFDFGRHSLSVLANGSLGWIQAANFLITGLLVIAAAIGVGRALGAKSRGVTWSLAGYGAAMVAAALFTADPMDGFPPGTPEGIPTSISTTGLLHFVFGALAFLCLAIAGFFAASAMRRRHLQPLASLSFISGLVVLVGFFGGVALPFGLAGIWTAVVMGWVWLSVMSLRLMRPI